MPEGMPWQSAVCLDPADFALAALRDAGLRLGDGVAIFGLGAIALVAVQLARLAGAGTIIGVDPDYQHQGVARRLSQEFVKNLKAIGVSVIYTLVNWNDWDLLKFFRDMGFTRGGDMINLELKVE